MRASRESTAGMTPDLHVHPQYRSAAPTDALAARIEPGSDEFVLEVDCSRVARVLDEWSSSLRQSPIRVGAIEKTIAAEFRGGSLQPQETIRVRSDHNLTIERLRFSSEASLRGGEFVKQLDSSLREFSRIVTAEFQVTEIERTPDGIKARVRYELVGSGDKIHREQRIGCWECEWTRDTRLLSCRTEWEERSRASAPLFAEVSGQVFAGARSYSEHLLRGVDHWRTTLDGASGIDLYGHNGVSVGDIDGDGFDDLYVCQPAGLPNRLYRNRGDGTFEDITEASGLGILDNTACALIVDIDNDGRQDVVAVRANGPLLFLNEGGGKFRYKPDAFGFRNAPQGTFTGAAAADYDGDGLLDIYFCLYVFYQGTDQYRYPVPYFDAENGPPNFLMRNNGDGTFRDVTAESGLHRNNSRFSFCCGWSDYNQDGRPDLYVANDFGRKNLYRNQGDGTFTDVAPETVIADVGAGMSVCWFDYNLDGREDLYVGDMWTAAGERISKQPQFKKEAKPAVAAEYRKHAMGNSVFRNGGNGEFEDATAASGAGVGRWSWSSDSFDFDHDGFPDLYIANGMISGPIRQDLNSFFWRQVVAKSPDEARSAPGYEQAWNALNELVRSDYSWSGYERNNLYANNRDGTFSDVAGVVGLDFVEDGRSFAMADFNHDGRQEMVLKNRNAPQLRVLQNIIQDLPPAISFRLRGSKSNRDAIGAAVSIEAGEMRQTKYVQAGSGFLAQHSKDVFFGVGESRGSLTATVRWPSGLTQTFHDLPPGHMVVIVEGEDEPHLEAFRKPFLPGPTAAVVADVMPGCVETWLLVPVQAPGVAHLNAGARHKPALLQFVESDAIPADSAKSFEVLAVNLRALPSSDETPGVYNLLYRYLFDRHRDLSQPTSFLIDAKGEIVKIYQGPVTTQMVERDVSLIPRSAKGRLAEALPFPGVAQTYEFARNNLSVGAVFFQRGYPRAAESFFEKAKADDPSSAEACYGLGSIYLQQNRVREAREQFERTIKLTAGYPDTQPNAWNNLGLIAMREGHPDEAVHCFEKALRIRPLHFISLENLGNAYRQQKRWDDARTTLQQALSVNADDPEANYSLGMVYAQTNELERADRFLKLALKLRPNYPEALNNLGILCLRSERPAEAIGYFEDSIRMAPDFDQSYLNLARVYAIQGNSNRARAVLEQLLDKHADNAEAQQMLEQMQ